MGFSYPAWEVRDADLGFITLAGAEGRWSSEGGGYVKFNAHGFRDRERALAKSEGTFRIAVIGDSFTQAREVELEETFVHLTEKRLEACTETGKEAVEVLNFGMGAYNTAAELQLWRKRVRAFSPDLVVLVFYVGNDINFNHPAFDYFKNIPGLGQPLFQLEDGRLALDMSFRDDPVFRRKLDSRIHRLALELINRSAVLQFLYFAKNSVIVWLARDAKEGVGGIPEEPPANAQVNPVASFKPPASADWREAWEMTEAGLSRMVSEVRQAGALFLMTVVAHPVQVHEADGRGAEEYTQKRLQRLAAREGFPLIDLLAPFRAAYRDHPEFLYGFPRAGLKASQKGRGHWNQRAHRLAADVISTRLCELLSGEAGN